LNSNTDKKPASGGESLTRAYWIHKVDNMTGPVAQFRMAQLIDYDRRLTDPARTVYRFLIGWYMHAKHGDALASVRHIVTTMRGRAPDGARHLSRSAVQRAIILLIECGWLVRTHVGKGRGGSRYVPVLNVLELASQGTLPDAEGRSVPDHRDTTEISVASHSTGTALSHSTGTLGAIASQITGTKTLLLDPSTDGATEREIDPAAPTAPDAAGLAPASPVTAVEDADAKPTFESLWRTYGPEKRGGKPEARAAWKALPPEIDRAAVIASAAAWRESWVAQNNPKAGRYTLVKWLSGERYEQDAPTGYQPKEKARKSKSAGKGKLGLGDDIKQFTITAYKSEGDVFTNFYETFTFRADDGQEFTERMHVVCASADYGAGKDRDLRSELYNAAFGNGNPEGDYIGRVVGVNEPEGRMGFWNLPDENPPAEPWTGDVSQLSPFGTFTTKIISSRAEHNEHGHFLTVTLEVDGRDVEHAFDIETQKGLAFLASICKATGLREIGDTEELHGLPMQCTITERGAISYAAQAIPLRDAA
jgi:hypothetical protein